MRSARKSVEFDERTVAEFGAELRRLEESPTNGPEPVPEVGDLTVADPSSSPSELPTKGILSDSWLSGCRRANWALRPEMTVSFGGNGLVRGAEEFRTMRSQLYRVRKQQNLKSVLVASALAKEGRSFVATNLARVLALQADCRVLLVDADLRNPGLHSAFGTYSAPGLSDYLLEEAEELEVIQRGRADNLYLIPCGREVQGQTELVANGRLQLLIDQIDSLFDWIIIDSPPASTLTDASLLSNSCEGVLLVVRSHSTPFDIVRKVRERFREESLVGVVLNKIESEDSAAR